MGKDSFIVYNNFYKPISKLSDEQLGRLFRSLFLYSIEGISDVAEDIQMPFDFFRNQMDMDMAKWEQKVEKLKANAVKAAEVKKKLAKQSVGATRAKACTVKPIATNCNQLQPIATNCNQFEGDNVKENVNDKENNNNLLLLLKKKETTTTTIFNFFFQKNLNPLRELLRFYAYNEERGWKLGSQVCTDKVALAKRWKGENNFLYSHNSAVNSSNLQKLSLWVSTTLQRVQSSNYDAFLQVLEGTDSINATDTSVTITCYSEKAKDIWEEHVSRENFCWATLTYKITNFHTIKK